MFIDKLKHARAERDEKDEREKAKADKKKADQDTSIFELLSKNPEPTFDTLEEALEAGKACKKCGPRISGYKGCRACMGEWFENIRLKSNSSSWHVKRIEAKLKLESQKNSQPIELE